MYAWIRTCSPTVVNFEVTLVIHKGNIDIDDLEPYFRVRSTSFSQLII